MVNLGMGKVFFHCCLLFWAVMEAGLAQVSTISPGEITGYETNPPPVRRLLDTALDLTKKKLGYQYGSAEPENGGMDCSGTIYYLLQKAGIEEVPRSSDGQYQWVKKEGAFRVVAGGLDEEDEALGDLKPGDLLFWTGTYDTERKDAVSHVMIYLGMTRDGKTLMVGASDGRTYNGKKMYGVSVFDFKTPREESRGEFIGFASIPGLE